MRLTPQLIYTERSIWRRRNFVKALLSILLGLMLLSSLLGVSYAAPTVLNSPCPPNNSNITPTDCHNPNNGADPHSHHGCSAPGQKGPDVPCCAVSHGSETTCCLDSTHGLEDGGCCNESITPQSPEASDIQVECF